MFYDYNIIFPKLDFRHIFNLLLPIKSTSVLLHLVFILFFSSNSFAANNKMPNKYGPLIRQMFERAFFEQQAGISFYFPFQTPECSLLTDNIRGLNVTKSSDISHFMTELLKIRNSIGGKSRTSASFERFVKETDCSPFDIDLTEDALTLNGKNLQFGIRYYRQVGDEKIQQALRLLEEPISNLIRINVDSNILTLLKKYRKYESIDELTSINVWIDLGINKIYVQSTQCSRVFDECTSIINIELRKPITDFGQ